MLPARTPAPRTRALAAPRPASALRSAVVALFAALGLTLVLAVVGALPAHAHDRLTGSEPADGSALDAPPAAITLTFNTEPLAVEPQVVVTDPAGTVVAEGAPTIDGTTATLPLDTAALTGGAYSVAWRVVSSDGHPIEGTFGFTVAEQPDAASSQSATAEESPETTEPDASTATASSAPADTPPTDAQDDAGDAGNGALPVVLGAIAVLAVAGVVTVLVLRRRGGSTDPQA